MTEAFVFLNEGFEEIEALTAVNVLRRGGVAVQSVSLAPQTTVTGGRGITVVADLDLAGFQAAYAQAPSQAVLILPGGPGTKGYFEGPKATAFEALVKAHHADQRPIAAICAAPTVLDAWGILAGRTAVCYPSLRLPSANPGRHPVETDGSLITARGPATSMAFALAILRTLKGDAIQTEVANQLLV